MKRYLVATSIIFSLLLPNLAPIMAEGLNAAEIVSQTNIHRRSNNLSSLQTSALLQKAAQMKAEDMAAKGYFSHNSPDGKTPWDWMKAAGYNFRTAGENIAMGYQTSKAVVDGWMNSPGHRANILNGAFTQIGIGIAQGKYNGHETTFIVQMLAMGDKVSGTLNPKVPDTLNGPKPTATPKPKPSIKPVPQKPAPTPIPAPPQTSQPDKVSGTLDSKVPDTLPPQVLFCSMDEILARKFNQVLPTETTEIKAQKQSSQNELFKWLKTLFIWPFWTK